MSPEIHLFILWQRARYKENLILHDMAEHFSILKKYAISWSQELVACNFTRFYGVNLPANSGKEKECGKGEFLLCIVRDEHPRYAERMTSRGPEIVNTNMFDAKQRYRQWTQGGHKVHATNNEKETNHDLKLLLGKNIPAFLSEVTDYSDEIVYLQKDLEGAKGWDSISQLFGVLNDTVSYVILRGVSDCKEDSFLERSDTDILTTEYRNLWYIVNGEPVYHHVRPKAKVVIGEDVFLLDIWDATKNYFDSMWTQQMLETSVFYHGMKVLSPQNDFYCLLYHCLTNKGYIADKYTTKLLSYRELFGIDESDWNRVLVNWLCSNQYDITEHTDPSNPFNISNPIIHEYALRYGKNIRSIQTEVYDVVTHEKISWISRVYRKEFSYVKKGTPWLIDNEVRFLSKIGDGIHFPKIIATGGDAKEHWVEISEMKGKELFHDKWGIRMRYIRRDALNILHLLEMLYKNDIMHRDIHNDNIYVDDAGNIAILDFGFAIDFRTDKEYLCPWNLGMSVAPQYMYSDFYNLAGIFEYRWSAMPFVSRFANELKQIDWQHYPDSEFVEQQITRAKDALNKGFTACDYWEYFLGKYKIRKYIYHPRKLLRRVIPDMSKAEEFMRKLPNRIIRKIKKIIHA